MLYRRYEREDFPALYAIEEGCFQPPLRFSRAYMRGIIQGDSSATWIAEQNGCMAGFAIIEWLQHEGATVAYLQTIEVAAERRRRGIAGALLRHAEASARAAGAHAVWLHVDAENRAAIRLYERHGYIAQGREEHYYARSRAALVYRKALAA